MESHNVGAERAPPRNIESLMMGKRHGRKHIRRPDYDYREPGAYFVTIVTHDRAMLFGRVVDGEMRPNALGGIVQEEWVSTNSRRPGIETDAFVLMPNHIHGILLIGPEAQSLTWTEHAPPLQDYGKGIRPFGPASGSLSAVVRALKSAVTKRINQAMNFPGAKVWQRNFYERIIRDEDELNRARQYIVENPQNWTRDDENPAA